MTKDYHIYQNVRLGENCLLENGVIIGLPPHEKKDGELATVIGRNAVIRSHTVIYAGTIIGDNLQTGHNVVIREDNQIGNNFSIWSNSVLSPHNRIGDNVKIHCNCFVESSTLDEGVFLGPHVVITDDPHPTCPHWEECLRGAVVRKNASIGGNATILPGVEIGESSLIGAGSVVTKNVLAESVMIGNPAKMIKKIKDLKCHKGFYKRPYEWRKK